MELCLGSMLDYYEKKLTNVSSLDIYKMMWEIALGLEYLHGNCIVHGSLVLDKILLWKNESISDSNTAIIKIALRFHHSTVNKHDIIFFL